MGEVKWIKLTTSMFEDEKIDFVESLPEADAILIIWIKLLSQAGKCNTNGFIFLTENIPYTEEMLAHKFRRPPSVVRLALETLKRLGMIEFEGEYLRITNWEKHQNIEGMEKIREQNRLRKQRQRVKEKQLKPDKNNSNVTSHATVTQGHATERELELELELELEREVKESVVEKEKSQPSPSLKSSFGDFGNVLLTEKELKDLKKELGEVNTDRYIKKLDIGIAEKGYKTKNHYITIKKWFGEDQEKETKEPGKKIRNLNGFIK